MGLSNELITQFAKITKDNNKKKTESTVYGTIVEYNNAKYVKLDGSDLLTPISSTTNMEPDERVTVMIKNHTATVTGNITAPAARGAEVTVIKNIVADKADIEELHAEVARIDDLYAKNATISGTLTAAKADIDELEAVNVTITGKLTAVDADIKSLQADDATIKGTLVANQAAIDTLTANDATITGTLNAQDAIIEDLKTSKLSATDADLRYATIDFSNIGEAAMENFYANSGLIENVVVGDGTITGNLVGVTISGDLIEGNTIIADKLVIRGSDGLYYKLNTDGMTIEAQQTDHNSLNGSVIKAKSITATKIAVDDLVAFDATIGGFHITDSSLYSGVKSTATNTTRGIYMDNDGQMVFGDATNFVKFYKDTDNVYRLAITAGDIILSSSQKNIETMFDDAKNEVYDSMDEQASSIISSTTNMIVNELDNYVETEDFDSYKRSQASLAVDIDNILLKINEEHTYAVNVDGRLEEFRKLVETYFDFSSTGLLIGKSDSPFTTMHSNSKISFMQNGDEVAYIQYNQLYILYAHFIEGLSIGNYSTGNKWVFEVDDYGLGIVWQ